MNRKCCLKSERKWEYLRDRNVCQMTDDCQDDDKDISQNTTTTTISPIRKENSFWLLLDFHKWKTNLHIDHIISEMCDQSAYPSTRTTELLGENSECNP